MKNELIIARKVAAFNKNARQRQLDIIEEFDLEDMTERFAY